MTPNRVKCKQSSHESWLFLFQALRMRVRKWHGRESNMYSLTAISTTATDSTKIAKMLKVAPSLTTLIFWPPNGRSKIQREDQHLDQMWHFDHLRNVEIVQPFLNVSCAWYDSVLPSLKICWSCVILVVAKYLQYFRAACIAISPYPICFFVAADIHSSLCMQSHRLHRDSQLPCQTCHTHLIRSSLVQRKSLLLVQPTNESGHP